MKNWFIGQEIVCLDDFLAEKNYYSWFGKIYEGIIYPEKDKIYTIRSISDFKNRICFHVKEIKNIDMDFYGGFHEVFFEDKHFAPLVKQKTDISIFTEILNKANKQKSLDLIDSH
jgi:hypothetical protein